MVRVEWTVTGEVVEWRGPSPYYFLPMSVEDSADLKIEAAGLEYWGQVAVLVRLGDTTISTALFPQGERYMVPLRVAVRRSEGLEVGMEVTATVRIRYNR
jgi:hypothetical protein